MMLVDDYGSRIASRVAGEVQIKCYPSVDGQNVAEKERSSCVQQAEIRNQKRVKRAKSSIAFLTESFHNRGDEKGDESMLAIVPFCHQ